ncbi:MAG: biotin synthase BioB [Rickettsiales bacterium]|jgi:biotin synthase|nr:biotin synthase BioB [Rickettsiales bacterium]
MWNKNKILELYELPFNDLIHKAHLTHRENFNVNQVQVSTLLSIKTGSCPENCKYCPQSAHYNTNIEKTPLLDVEQVISAAKAAKAKGSSRFCMGAAWRNLNDRDVPQMCEMVKEVKKLGLETCLTLGMITGSQADKLKESGLDYYNHNIDSSKDYYEKIITTRNYQDRLDTIQNVANANIHICSGGIVGMGEKREDRAEMIATLASFNPTPKSIPINLLEKIEGTPLEHTEDLDIFEFIRTIAATRIAAPASYVRLSAGRKNLSKEAQALCFYTGANSIFYGDTLLTQDNPSEDTDKNLFNELGLKAI